jgi:flagellar hook-associated protein FlgK
MLELTEFTEEYNGYVAQLHQNIATLKAQLREVTDANKQLRKELSIAKQSNAPTNLWAELSDGRDT